MRFIDHNLTVAVLCNFPSSNPWYLAQQVAEVYLEEFMVPKEEPDSDFDQSILTSADLQKLAGIYVHPLSKNAYTIAWSKGNLLFQAGPGYQLIPTAENVYLLENTPAKIELVPGNNGQGTARFLPFGDQYYFNKAWKPSDVELKNFEGTYYSKELDTEYLLEGRFNFEI